MSRRPSLFEHCSVAALKSAAVGFPMATERSIDEPRRFFSPRGRKSKQMTQQTRGGSTEGANARRRGNADEPLTSASRKSLGLHGLKVARRCHSPFSCATKLAFIARVLLPPAEASPPPDTQTQHESGFAIDSFSLIYLCCVLFFPGEQPRGNLISDVGGKGSE